MQNQYRENEHVYTLTTKDQKDKLKKQFIYHYIKKNKTPRDKPKEAKDL